MTTPDANPPVEARLGLRFARHVERFAPAEAAEGELGVDRLTDVPAFPQLPGRLDAAMGGGLADNPRAEDAYFLNVWAPRGAAQLPVLVFLHGGAWSTGAGSARWYSGETLAAAGMVVVTLNYRIGALAHLTPDADSDPTPLAIGDILHALRWVQRNIGAFGGDPDRVTLAGQSAGGWYCHVLNLLPEAAGLFDGVALWSMATRRPWPVETLRLMSARAAEGVGGGDLRGAPIDDLLTAGAAALRSQRFPFGTPGSAYLPAVSPVLPADLYAAEPAANRSHANRIWVRTTAGETAAFFFGAPERDITTAQWKELWAGLPAEDRAPGIPESPEPYRALIAQTTWQHFERFPLAFAGAAEAAGRTVTVTQFDTESALPGFLSGHTLDLPYQFGDRTQWADAPMLAGEQPDRFASVAGQLFADTIRFVQAIPVAAKGD
ncbi:carboxylesterase family protein [Granulicoccus sp. GXG6511]|uniref:carboxylesterase family protein n=1 Tax=Granulicoccus sp. GXG6511 TaxID=3381351 RepID=UPI003D7CC6EB